MDLRPVTHIRRRSDRHGDFLRMVHTEPGFSGGGQILIGAAGRIRPHSARGPNRRRADRSDGFSHEGQDTVIWSPISRNWYGLAHDE